MLTPFEAGRFDSAHPLVGSVVFVEVAFDAEDPRQPELDSKERPALVVAATTDAILVRAIYSHPSSTRAVFQPWRRVGLEHPCFVDDTRVVVELGANGAPRSLGRLTAAEWNSLI